MEQVEQKNQCIANKTKYQLMKIQYQFHRHTDMSKSVGQEFVQETETCLKKEDI